MRLDGSLGATPTALLLSLLSLASLALAARPKDAILLSKVKSLTLTSPGLTTSRRTSPIPQLTCLSSPSLCRLAAVRTLRCVNAGSSYSSEDISWSCTATLPSSSVRLDRTDVICEGYDGPDDVYVLRGSCGVEYTVALTEEGRERYPGLDDAGERKGRGWEGLAFGVVFLAVLGWIVWGAWTGAAGGQGGGGNRVGGGGRRPPGGGGGGGWGPGWGPGGGGGTGGGPGGWDDPPPPYPGPKPSSSSQGWTPGFWSGLAGGAAAGYMAGSRQSGDRSYGGGRRNNNTRWGSGGSRFGHDSGSSSSWGSGSSSSSSGGQQHESTGYGGTSRR